MIALMIIGGLTAGLVLTAIVALAVRATQADAANAAQAPDTLQRVLTGDQ